MAKRKININKSSIALSKSGVKRNKLAGGILITGIILLIVLLLLILLSVGFFESPKEEQLFPLRDECSLVMGSVIHNIRDVGDCHIRCRNDCDVRKLEFVRVSFLEKNNSCHECDCYCK